MSDHQARAHSLLSPSGASRWMNCTPSARKEEFIEDISSPYAREGTLAHELAELELRKHFGYITHDQYKEGLGIIENDEMYSDEMPEEVDKYVQYCIEQYDFHKQQKPKWLEISIEDKIDLTQYIEDGFGSNDWVMVAEHVVEVIDLKYGRGVAVSAIRNEQLMLYALGALWKHELTYDIREVKITIVQPRTNNISSFIISADELKKWGEEEVKPKAEMAFAGKGELNPGSWCKFCKFKPKCRAVFEANLKLIREDFADPDEITQEEILEVYERKEQIVSWLNSIDAFVLNQLMKKEPVPGYKLVKGRANRVITQPIKVIQVLTENGFDKKDFMSEPKLLGIGVIEKLVGKTKFPVLLGELVEKPEGKPTIALESDKRDSFFTSVEDDFSQAEDLV
jgi:hypothetical protein